jgi:hypothetical protein
MWLARSPEKAGFRRQFSGVSQKQGPRTGLWPLWKGRLATRSFGFMAVCLLLTAPCFSPVPSPEPLLPNSPPAFLVPKGFSVGYPALGTPGGVCDMPGEAR